MSVDRFFARVQVLPRLDIKNRETTKVISLFLVRETGLEHESNRNQLKK